MYKNNHVSNITVTYNTYIQPAVEDGCRDGVQKQTDNSEYNLDLSVVLYGHADDHDCLQVRCIRVCGGKYWMLSCPHLVILAV